EKDARTDLETLPQSRNEGSSSHDTAAAE
ncbi:hypothetical protein Tco_1494827, partial [Tanacetum coccineum]